MKAYQIKNILVPIDFSTISLNAVNHAEQLAKLTHAKITLLYVVKPYVDAFGTSGMLIMASKIERQIQIEGIRRLREIASSVKKRSGIQIKALAMIGPIASTIRKISKDIKANLIIMGTHGASGFVDNWIGSNTYHVSTLSEIPVLSVNKRVNPSGYNVIIYPVRERAKAMDKFSFALAFAKLYNSRVHIIGFIRKNQKQDEKNVRIVCGAVKKQFIENKIEAKTVFTLEDKFAEATIRYAKKYPKSLVVIRQDQDFRLVEVFRGTYAKNVLHKILVPVLTITGR